MFLTKIYELFFHLNNQGYAFPPELIGSPSGFFRRRPSLARIIILAYLRVHVRDY